MADEPDGRTPGFEIKSRFYEFPSSFRVCDPILVREVTGLTFAEFSEGLDAFDNADADVELDPVLLAGLIAVGIWQKFPNWRRDQVVQYVERLGNDQIKMVGLEPAGPEEEDPPPLPETPETASQPSSPGSSSEPEPPSAPPSQSISGPADSPTGALE